MYRYRYYYLHGTLIAPGTAYRAARQINFTASIPRADDISGRSRSNAIAIRPVIRAPILGRALQRGSRRPHARTDGGGRIYVAQVYNPRDS